MVIKGNVANVTCTMKKIDSANISYRTHKAYMGILDCLRHNDVRHNDVRHNDVRDNETQWYIVCMTKKAQ